MMGEVTEAQLNDYVAGKIEMKDLLELEPDYVEKLKGRAQFFLDGGHNERALIMLEMLEELDRTDPMPSLLAIELLLKDGRSDAAEEKVNELLERLPDNDEVKVAQAEVKIAAGEMVAAAKILEAVIGRDSEGKTPAGQRALAVAARAHAQISGG